MRIIDSFKKFLWVKLGVIYLRYLMGFAFVFASPVKITGHRFTTIPADQPVGHFFEALYQTGVYWRFLGICQFAAGALLMTQRFSTLGAMAFFGIIRNVFVITISIDFGMGTPLITALMLCGTVSLLLWDYRKLAVLFLPDHKIDLRLAEEPKDEFMNDPVWSVTGLLFILFTIVMQVAGNVQYIIGWEGLMLFTGLAACIIGLLREKKRRKHSSAQF